MDDRTELERIDASPNLDELPPGAWTFLLELGFKPVEAYSRIRAVVREINERSHAVWPENEEWLLIVPPWLREALPQRSREESERLMRTTPREQWHLIPWHFDTWIDAIRDRSWEWWGAEVLGGRARIVLKVAGTQARVEAFRKIVLASGAVIKREHQSS